MRFFLLFSFWVLSIFFSLLPSNAQMDETTYMGNNQVSPPPPPLPRPLLHQQQQQQSQTPPAVPAPPYPVFDTQPKLAPFRPSIAVIIGVLTTMFSITFLLLLYAKHCKGRNGNNRSSRPISSAAARKNSGIDRSVIESLPIFRFASLRGQKDGLECAVCLNRFDHTEVLKLLPKCKHAFHVECVDTWLDAHSTCPLCRYRVDPEDVLLLKETKFGIEGSIVHEHKGGDEGLTIPVSALEAQLSEEISHPVETIRRISGRHSSAGERASHFIVLQRPGESNTRHSFCSSSSLNIKKKNETVAVGCLDRGGGRKDGLLLGPDANRADFMKRFDHRIILSNECGADRRWSDLRPSDLMYLRSQMMVSDKSSMLSVSEAAKVGRGDGSEVINARSVSEITGVSRFGSRGGAQLEL